LWQARFHSTTLDEEHFWAAMVYVERNPVQAALMEQTGQWRWSSARANFGLAPSGPLDMARWQRHFDANLWQHCLSGGPGAAALEDRIRQATRSGFPLGDDEFRQELSRRFGVQTEPAEPGRPRKPVQSEALPFGDTPARGILKIHNEEAGSCETIEHSYL
ncbi:MAG: hypothetical protein M3Y57_22635, partial [Acidobacteriota bacterium]|nr:hypothetical protein [Acidobacteriota bacterium]